MLRIRNPSLELNWLPNSIRKGMPTPRMAIVDGADYGGAYWRKTKDRCVLDGLDVDLKEGGFIALGTIRNAGCIAHEYRHHWQIQSGYRFGASVWRQNPGESYERSIVRYFRSYWWEMDALKFQLKHAPDEISLYWKELLLTTH